MKQLIQQINLIQTLIESLKLIKLFQQNKHLKKQIRSQVKCINPSISHQKDSVSVKAKRSRRARRISPELNSRLIHIRNKQTLSEIK
ncbi:hypothetical protein pb186bvf_010912 [Paramecium bursaria]